MKKAVVYFKGVAKSKKLVYFTEKPAYVYTKLGGGIVCGPKHPDNFGKQYLVSLNCLSMKSSDFPEKNSSFEISCTEKQVINKKTNKPIQNLYWGKV